MSTAKTSAQRQSAYKARQKAAGKVLFKRWVHSDDVALLEELAVMLADKRAMAGGASQT
jgi:hypothetical protein